ncbi:MAG TPA: type II toxin-antitoxin system VapC family toxin [Myxococcota bacterium]|nr:type II toxin-antitoxin system VapC family toxin [Myxococcota bacterium]HNH45700.1 type II toxin-antitoxin system VapC family toxin [Myxococcota bacterium]
MNLLLDTHIWLWASLDPHRLTPRAQAELENTKSNLHISALSWWEFLLAHRKGRLQIEGDPIFWGRQSIHRLGLQVLPITEEIAIQAEHLPGFERQDPGDRFIIATARVHGFPLVTADEWILRWSGVETIW